MLPHLPQHYESNEIADQILLPLFRYLTQCIDILSKVSTITGSAVICLLSSSQRVQSFNLISTIALIHRVFLEKDLFCKLQKLRNCVIRPVNILKSVAVCNLQERIEWQLTILMYKIENKMLPNYLTEIFTGTYSIHDYNTIREIANLNSRSLILKQKA